MKKLHIRSVNGHSLSEINEGIENYFSKKYEISHSRTNGDIYIQHYVSKIKSYNNFKTNILIQPVDGTLINSIHIDSMNEFDIVVTPSEASKKILIDNGTIKPIFVNPNYYDPKLFVDNSTFYQDYYQSDLYTFYTESTGIYRKNLYNLIEKFVEEFSSEDNVRLIVKLSGINKDLENDYSSRVSKKVNHPRVEFINAFINGSDLNSIRRGIDCYICLSFIEGFCIPLLNEVVLKKDIICLDSKISGYMDFINSDNAYLLPVQKRKILINGPEIYTDNAEWEEPFYDEYKVALRKVSNGEYVFNKNQNYSRFSFDSVMKRYSDIIEFGYVDDIASTNPIDSSKLTTINGKIVGKMNFYFEDDSVGTFLKKEKQWESYMEDIFNNHLNSNSNAIDVGCHYGILSVMLSRICRDGLIFSFDPNRQLNTLRSFDINNCRNISFYPFAISDMVGETFLTENENTFINHISEEKTGKVVPVYTLDYFSFPKVDLIKIDVEGHEIGVLKGAAKLIERDSPVIIIEIWPHNYEEYKKYFESIQYSLEFIDGSVDNYIAKRIG